jgi:hypothetical protein
MPINLLVSVGVPLVRDSPESNRRATPWISGMAKIQAKMREAYGKS